MHSAARAHARQQHACMRRGVARGRCRHRHSVDGSLPCYAYAPLPTALTARALQGPPCTRRWGGAGGGAAAGERGGGVLRDGASTTTTTLCRLPPQAGAWWPTAWRAPGADQAAAASGLTLTGGSCPRLPLAGRSPTAASTKRKMSPLQKAEREGRWYGPCEHAGTRGVGPRAQQRRSGRCRPPCVCEPRTHPAHTAPTERNVLPCRGLQRAPGPPPGVLDLAEVQKKL